MNDLIADHRANGRPNFIEIAVELLGQSGSRKRLLAESVGARKKKENDSNEPEVPADRAARQPWRMYRMNFRDGHLAQPLFVTASFLACQIGVRFQKRDFL